MLRKPIPLEMRIPARRNHLEFLTFNRLTMKLKKLLQSGGQILRRESEVQWEQERERVLTKLDLPIIGKGYIQERV